MTWFKNASLSVKFILLALLLLILFLITNVGLLIYSTQSFTNEIGNERIQEAVAIAQTSLSDARTQISNDTNNLAADITFFQAVGRRDIEEVQDIILGTNLGREIYTVEVFDGDGNILFENTGKTDAHILPQSLDQSAESSLLIQEVDGEFLVSISVAVPIVSVTGNVLGAIRVIHHIDEGFLQMLISQQQDVFAGLIYQSRLIVESNPLPEIEIDEQALSQNEVVYTETFKSSGTPYLGAYLPLGDEQAALLMLVDLSGLYGFQNTILNNSALVFLLILTLTVGLIYFALYRIVINPIDRLNGIAQEMTSGNYARRIPVDNHDELGKLAATFNLMADAIQQREESLLTATENAERSNQVKSAFLASMSHELRTPLNSVLNFSKFVARGVMGPVNEKQTDALNKVINSGKHLLNLINDVLDMSKIESGSLTLFVEDNIDIKQILDTAVSTAEGLLQDRDSVELKTEIAETLPIITGDRKRMLQVVLNVVSNACKFVESGHVSIAAKTTPQAVLIQVSDTGMGIAPEDHEAVFQPFKQTDTGLRQGGGTGLGMPISKSLVEAHGGRLWFESERSKGTTFYVEFPLESSLVVTT